MKTTLAILIFFMAAPSSFGQNKPNSRTLAQALRAKLKPGPKTTVLLGPMRAAGYPDYRKALNRTGRQSVAGKENAFVILAKLIHFQHNDGYQKIIEHQLALLGHEPSKNRKRFIPWPQSISSKIQNQILDHPWQAKDHPKTAEWIQSNIGTLQALHTASRMDGYHAPLYLEDPNRPMIEAMLPQLAHFRAMASLMVADANLALSEGHVKRAWGHALALHRLGLLIAKGPTLVEYLVGLAISNTGATVAHRIARHRQLTEATCVTMLKQWRSLPALTSPHRTIDQAERFQMLDAALWVATMPEGLKGFLESVRTVQTTDKTDPGQFSTYFKPISAKTYERVDWNRVLQDINQDVDQLLEIGRQPYPMQSQRFKQFDQKMVETKNSVVRPELIRYMAGLSISTQFISALIRSILMPAMPRVYVVYRRNMTEHRMAGLALAIQAEKHRTGDFPLTFETLVPRYFLQAPQDAFSGKAFRYKRLNRGAVLYSVGENGLDDGGVSSKSLGAAEPDDVLLELTP